MFKLAPLILRNVARNRRRTLLTLASTAVSLSLLAVLLAIYQGFFYGEDVTPSSARRMICRHKVSLIQPLPESHRAVIEGMPGVQLVSGYSWFQGVYKEPRNFFARFAVDADKVFDMEPEWTIPAGQLAAFKRNRTGCAIAEKIAKDYKIKLGDTMVIVGDIYPVTLELKVEGIFGAPTAMECLVFHQEYLSELLPASFPEKNMVGTYLILVDRPEHVPDIAKAIDDRFSNSPYPTRTESEKEFGRSFLAFLGNVRLVLAAICGAVTFTIMLVSANTVAMAVRERTREMAILRTLGYRPGEILRLVLGEAVEISVVGALLGLGGGWVISKGVEALGAMVGAWLPALKWQAGLIVLGVAAAVGLIAALVPALIASRKNVVESLRFTG